MEAENVYEDFYKKKELFDFNDYPKDLKCYNDANKVVVGKIKNEMCGVPIKCFPGLKSKMDTFITKDNHEPKKVKYVNKNVVDEELKYKDYKIVLFNRSYMKHEMNRIQSKDHNIGSYTVYEKFLYFLKMKKYIYLKMDILGYHIFINLLVNHIKTISLNLGNLF